MWSLNKFIPHFTASILIILIGVIGCSGDMPIQGFDLTDAEDIGIIDSTGINKIALEISFKDTAAVTGKSPLLLLGAFANIEAQILLKFENLPDSVVVTNAAIELKTSTIIGNDSKSSFTATVHRITSDWDESKVKDETFGNAYDVNSIGMVEILSVDREFFNNDSLIFETVRIPLNTQGVDLVNNWIDTTSMVENNGVFIDFSNSHFIKEFFSNNNLSNQPRLELEVLKNGSERDTTSFIATADAFLVRSLSEPPAGPLYIDNVFSRQSVIKFDLSEIPRESTINRATLELNVYNQDNLLTDDGFTMQIVRLSEPFSMPNTYRPDSSITAILATVVKSTSTLSIPIAP
ncbi:MAG: DNRLRE domain-containing protein, partial [bacterium]